MYKCAGFALLIFSFLLNIPFGPSGSATAENTTIKKHRRAIMGGEISSQTKPGHVAQSVASLAADPGVASLIPVRSHTFVELYYEIISTVILLLPLIQEGLLSFTSARNTG